MKRIGQNRFAFFPILLALLAVLVIPGQAVLAHGGEDHGDEKKVEAVPVGGNMVTRAVRVGDFEVTIKHPAVAPDQETSARIFVTRFATNEPVGNAKITVIVDDAAGGTPVEVAATAGATPGIYDVKLPPMMKGECKLSARIDVEGTSVVANYGAMHVAPAPAQAITGIALWARTGLIGLGIITLLGIVGVAVYLVAQHFRRTRMKEQATAAA